MPWVTPKYACGHRGEDVPCYGNARDRETVYNRYTDVLCPRCRENEEDLIDAGVHRDEMKVENGRVRR